MVAKKGETWLEEECEVKRKFKKKCGGYKNSDTYKKMSTMMKLEGFHRDWIQCRTKLKHLKSDYKKYKNSLSRPGAGRGMEPNFLKK